MTPPTTFHISGMHCASCASNIQRALTRTPGVTSASVNYGSAQASVSHEPNITPKIISQLIHSLGYTAHFGEDTNDIADKERRIELVRLRTHFWISTIFSSLLVIGAMFPFSPQLLKDPIIALILATPVQFYIGLSFYKSALSALKNRTANMDTLIALGTSVAYFFSVASVFFMDQLTQFGIPPHMYFETSAAIITLVILGKYLELRAKSQTNQAIRQLLSLQAKIAHKVHPDGQVVDIPLQDVQLDDILRVLPGEKVPTDGIILSGTSSIDESMVTGESLPVTKTISNSVIGSTINIDGTLELKVQKIGSQTLLSQIIQLVQSAQNSRPPIQNLVDTISSYFVPTVIIISLLTFAIWALLGNLPFAISSAISVLIIACPCALGLATPTSLIVGIGKAASLGILIKDASALQSAHNIKAVLFDKTGTLTQGQPAITQANFLNGLDTTDQNRIISFLLGIQSLSTHPLAKACTNYAATNYPEILPAVITKLQNFPGLGQTAYSGKNTILVGSPKFIEKQSINIPDQFAPFTKAASTTIFLAINNKLYLSLQAQDQPKPESLSTIQQLQSNHITPIMVTGDNARTAEKIASQLGITHYLSDVLPDQKEQAVHTFRSQFGSIAFVGDGINDAPALAAADVGISMGTGTDIAIQSSGITLLRGNLSLVPTSLRLSRAVISNIRQNLAWAFGYNIILIPVAAGVLYPIFGFQLNPILAALAMSLSSISVVANSLRLKYFRP